MSWGHVTFLSFEEFKLCSTRSIKHGENNVELGHRQTSSSQRSVHNVELQGFLAESMLAASRDCQSQLELTSYPSIDEILG